MDAGISWSSIRRWNLDDRLAEEAAFELAVRGAVERQQRRADRPRKARNAVGKKEMT
jgi:hypothetical protein